MNRPLLRPLFEPKPLVVFLALLLAALLGTVNYATGHEVSVSAFYLIPICWACWAAGRRAGLLVATIATVVW
jgi:cell shape-determining protein MreD